MIELFFHFAYQELGLVAGIPVGTSLIDAHAGGVGVMESIPVQDSDSKGWGLSYVFSSFFPIIFHSFILKIIVVDFNKEMILHRMALVCGTSTCHMAVSRDKLFTPGVWGPFWSGMTEINSNCSVKFFIF